MIPAASAPLQPLVPPADVMGCDEAAAPLQGIARHVTEDGCQFALQGGPPEKGARLSCMLTSNPPVTGVVRWIVQDRIGFAFDHLFDAGSLAELASHFAQVKAIELVRLPEPALPQ